MKVLVKYVREPIPNLGYFNVGKTARVLEGKELDKKGNPIDPVAYMKSTINYFKVACLVAIKDDDGTVLVGYSQWNRNLDAYDPRQMLDVAIDRAHILKSRAAGPVFWVNLPSKIWPEMEAFLVRATKYFKGAKFVPWAEDMFELGFESSVEPDDSE